MDVSVHPNDIRSLVKVVNMLGQEVNPAHQAKGTPLMYLYNDASVEKKIN
jgi:bisphosphoglycerate-dependent phosphoglycerate mutase